MGCALGGSSGRVCRILFLGPHALVFTLDTRVDRGYSKRVLTASSYRSQRLPSFCRGGIEHRLVDSGLRGERPGG